MAHDGEGLVQLLPQTRTSTGCICTCSAWAARWVSRSCAVVLGLAGFTRTATCVMAGTASLSNSSRFPLNSGAERLSPCQVLAGRARLVTKPVSTGSLLAAITTEMVLVAASDRLDGLWTRGDDDGHWRPTSSA